MRLEEALSQLHAMNFSLQRAERYCCYQAGTTALSSGLALGAAALQSHLVQDPADDFVPLWLCVAGVCMSLCAAELARKWWCLESLVRRQQLVATVSQFVPCLVAGGLVTLVVSRHAVEHAELLPGLWSILFGMGIFASARQLPPAVVHVATYYVLMGCAAIAWFRGSWAFSPWAMVLTFGVGQGLSALVLMAHHLRERRDVE